MASDWKETVLGEVVNLKRGFDLPSKQRLPGNIPIISSSGVSDFNSEWKVKGPGVVTGRYGTIGKVFYSEEDFFPLNTTLYVESFKGNDPRFIYYFLHTIDYQKYSDKAAVPGVNRNHLHTAHVLLPSIDDQRQIASVLKSFDDKIALLRGTNATLEGLAQALFKSWFVDFDPVRARAEGRDPEGVPPEMADLFPCEFMDSELGAIPRGWSVGVLASATLLSKQPRKPQEESKTEFEHYSLPAFDNGQCPVFEPGEAIKSNKFAVTSDSVLVSKLNPHIPRIWLPAVANPEVAICSTEFLVLVPKPGMSREWIYLLANSEGLLSGLRQLVTGTSNSHQRVKPENLMDIRIVKPPQIVLTAFTEIAKPLLGRVLANRIEAQSLATTRDVLLPRLMSGKLSIPAAGSALEATS